MYCTLAHYVQGDLEKEQLKMEPIPMICILYTCTLCTGWPGEGAAEIGANPHDGQAEEGRAASHAGQPVVEQHHILGQVEDQQSQPFLWVESVVILY